MHRKFAVSLIILLLLTSISLSACGKTDEQKVMSAVNQYIEAMNKEDLDAVQESLHRENMGYFYVKQQLPGYFLDYDVKTVLEDAKYEGIENGVASVSYVMTTRSIEASDFKDTRISGRFTLKQNDEGDWKILSIDYDPLTSIEYLTPEP